MHVETLAFGYGLIEGPCLDADESLYFSDVTEGGVWRRTPNGTIETIVPRRRGVGGIVLHADGGLVISGRNICHVRSGKTRVLLERPDIPGFNDITTDAQGCVYAGSMRADPFSTEGERTPGELFRIDADRPAVEVYGDVSLSNGLGFSPDGRRLYHCDTARGAILVHAITSDGRATDRAVFAEVEGPDGLAVDEEGGVWVALYGGGAVARFTPTGGLERRIEVPARAVTSLCFGGRDRGDLYVVTADNTEDPARGGTIFRTRSPVAGLPVHPARV
jgi:gluconolactonase